ERERFRLEWVSAAEGVKFQQICDEFTEQIKKLGPLNLNGGKDEHREA
ncbi:MAG: hydrogenase iron-sulfur subunit, partial [Candidatus Aminicenantes bacterium]|nr:hydrogenase iron-sulfur subunit [Candidatus Aminicenantes bacterium]